MPTTRADHDKGSELRKHSESLSSFSLGDFHCSTMHGVPVDLPLAAFVGFTLDQICIGQFQVQFHFSGEPGITARISVEGGWDLQDSQGARLDRDQDHFDRQHYKLHFLLGRPVASFSVDAPRSFQLVFESGHRLTVHDDNEHFEAFSVHPPNGTEVYV